MTSKPYLKPIGILPAPVPGPGLSEEESFFGGLPLTGDGSLYYTAVELYERLDAGGTKRRVVGLGELWEKDFGLDGARVSTILERISDPRSRLAGLGFDRPLIMGIVNVTPDSFSDGGKYFGTQAAIDHALRLEDEGADILDIGGESTRPNADFVSVDAELERVMPVLEGLAGRVDARISIDTRKSEVMSHAARAGVDVINDVSALSFDPESLATAADTGLPIILMHSAGTPKTMQDNPDYEDVLLDVYDYLDARIMACVGAGIARSRLIIDPGIGFGKTVQHNLALIGGVSMFHGLGVPIMLGASRKRFIGEIMADQSVSNRLPGSIAAAISAVSQGVQIVRVHDVIETREALTVWRESSQAVG